MNIDKNIDGFDFNNDGDYIDGGDVKGIAQWAAELAEAEDVVADLQTSYTAAVAALPALQAAEIAAEDALAAKNAEITANTTMSEQLIDVRVLLTTQSTNFSASVNAKKNDIEAIKTALANINNNITGNDYDREFVEGQLANEQEELANINSEIADLLAIADEWKALLDAIIG